MWSSNIKNYEFVMLEKYFLLLQNRTLFSMGCQSETQLLFSHSKIENIRNSFSNITIYFNIK